MVSAPLAELPGLLVYDAVVGLGPTLEGGRAGLLVGAAEEGAAAEARLDAVAQVRLVRDLDL